MRVCESKLLIFSLSFFAGALHVRRQPGGKAGKKEEAEFRAVLPSVSMGVGDNRKLSIFSSRELKELKVSGDSRIETGAGCSCKSCHCTAEIVGWNAYAAMFFLKMGKIMK